VGLESRLKIVGHHIHGKDPIILAIGVAAGTLGELQIFKGLLLAVSYKNIAERNCSGHI
jgi:hypothetical protein